MGENRDRLMKGVEELLAPIPGVLEFRGGKSVPSPRGVVDDSFAVAISMTFEDQAAADIYQAHPLHTRFIEEVVKPNVTRFVVYDFGV